jgi:hypothetical protein
MSAPSGRAGPPPVALTNKFLTAFVFNANRNSDLIYSSKICYFLRVEKAWSILE